MDQKEPLTATSNGLETEESHALPTDLNGTDTVETDAFTPEDADLQDAEGAEGELLEPDAPDDQSATEKAVVREDYDPEEWSSAPLRDPKTGRWVAGTGSSKRGGRPKGARDKITTQMIKLAEETAAKHGQEMFERLAVTDPAACLALITRLLPNADLSKAIEGEAAEGSTGPMVINIGLTKAPERLSHDDKPPVVRELPDGRVEPLNPPVSTYQGKASKQPPPIVNRSPEVERRRTDGGYGRRHRGASEPINYRDEDVI